MPGKTGLDVLREAQHTGRRPADHRDDRLQHREHGDRGDPARGLRLHHQAVRSRPCAGDGQQLLQAPGTRQPGPGAAGAARRARPEGADRRHHPGDAGGLQDDRAGRPRRRERADHRRDRHGQRVGRRDDPQELDLQSRPARSRSTAPRSPRRCWRANSSATRRAPSPARSPSTRGASSRRTRARSSSTRSAR